MDLLLDPLAVQKPCIQERSAAFRNFDSGDFGQIQGNHLDSLGWSNMSSQMISKVRIGTDWWAWHWIGRFLRVWNSFPQGKRFSGVEKVPWICCWTPWQFRNPASRREVRHSGDFWADSGDLEGCSESLRLALDRLFLCFWGSFNQGTWFGAWPPPPAEDKHQAQQYITTFHSFTEHVWTCRIFMDLYGSSRIFQPCPFASCLQARCWKTLQRHMHCHNLLRKDSQLHIDWLHGINYFHFF